MKYVSKNGILAILLAAVLGLSGCDLLRQTVPTKETQEQTEVMQGQAGTEAPGQTEQEVVIDTEDGIPFIETEPEETGFDPGEEAATEGAAAGDLLSEEVTEAPEADFMVVPDTETEDLFLVVPDTETEDAGQVLPAGTETDTGDGSQEYPELIRTILEEVIAPREALSEHWSVGYEDLQSGESFGYQDTEIMQSASVVKLFIMGAVYRYMCYPPEGEEPIPFGESYDGQLRETIEKMITVSDNDAANLLIERLGEGDFSAGAQRIKAFCEEKGYPGTSIGRRFLEENPTGDNYTTAADTRKFLSDIYHGRLVNEEASGKMLTIVKGQTRKNKVPAGLPEGFTSGNKTGEMPEGYGLGCIENDCAIVFPPQGQGEGYILTILSNELGGRNDEAVAAIQKISSLTAEWYLKELAEVKP